MPRTPPPADSFVPEALEARVLLAADPIVPDNPFWYIPRGSAVIDGNLSDADWSSAYEVFRTQATRNDRAVSVKMMYNDAGLFLSARVQDAHLWADGTGAGAGNRWEVETDDSITFYFDPNDSRDEFFQSTDRAFGINLGNPADPLNRSDGGTVRRWKYVKGDGAGGAPDVNGNGVLNAGMAYATQVQGTINNNSDTDVGWSTEVFMPWAALNMSGPPAHGQTIGMNFDMIQDNDGGPRNQIDNRSNPDPNVRFLQPDFIDDNVQGVQSSYTATQAGIHGPVDYADVMFVDPRAGQRPAAISLQTVTGVSPFGARLNFNAPAGTTTGLGDVSGYEVRYSSAPIDSEGKWLEATAFSNSYVPRLRGLQESLRLAILTPGTAYFAAVRAVDAAGNLGDISNNVTFTTSALPVTGYKGNIIPSPHGRTLMFENGQPFAAVGDHLGLTWQYTRTAFPGLIWDNVNHQFLNFSDPAHTAVENLDAYLDSLQAQGINTMRVYLELGNVYTQGNPGPLPVGTDWIEDSSGVYNPDMRSFVTSLLNRASTRGMYLILSPFDTFSFDTAFNVEGPWGTAQGGPLTNINQFFQNPLGVLNQQTLDISQNRMQAVVNWVNASGAADHVLGYEFLSEWDSYQWTLWPTDDSEPGRETEFRTRARFMELLAQFVKHLSPDHLVLNSTIAPDPRGPLARLDFYSRSFDALVPHIYTASNQEPINNPQADKSILPAEEMGYFTSYWISNRTDHAPMLNGEWGMTRRLWPGGLPQYSAAFTQQQDEAIFRTVTWSGFASGQFGAGLRIATDELAFRGMLLTDTMRAIQHSFSAFVKSPSLPINYANFNFDNLAGRINVSSAAGKTLLSWGVSDGAQGLAYILQDGNRSSGTVSDAVLTIDGLRADQIVDAEVWLTGPGVTGPLATVGGVFVASGQYVLALPAFAQDVVVKFKARAPAGQTQHVQSVSVGSFIVTFAVGPDQQPAARIMNAVTGAITSQDVASLAGFRGRVIDITPYVTSDGAVHLALTDTNHHLWILTGDIASGAWSSIDMTTEIKAPGITGDLTTYQPSWGAQQIAGIDARGHSVNYWWAPGLATWQFSDLTTLFNGPVFTKGLTAYVSGWDGLNIAGLNDAGEVVVYWWAPGLTDWQTINMTTTFNGPALTGQLDAFVTSWGGMNIAGTDANGHIITYWWAPGLTQWFVSDLTSIAGGPVITRGTEIGASADGGINVFGLDASDHLQGLRWTPADQVWRPSDITTLSGGPSPTFPLSSAASGNRLLVSAGGSTGSHGVVLFSFFLDTHLWSATTTDLILA